MNLVLRKDIVKPMAWVYTGLILLLVTLPINGEDQFLGKLNDNFILEIRFDYISHALLFIPFIVLVWYGWDVADKSRNAQLLSFLGCLGFAIFCEYLQLPLTYRTFNINDLLANSLGILLGFLLIWGWGRLVS